MQTYKIIRFYFPDQAKEPETIREGLTLAEAQKHCQDDTTMEDDIYFDGYEAE